jgi:hypothetical protein
LKQGDRVEILSFIGGGAPVDVHGKGIGFVHAE